MAPTEHLVVGVEDAKNDSIKHSAMTPVSNQFSTIRVKFFSLFYLKRIFLALRLRLLQELLSVLRLHLEIISKTVPFQKDIASTHCVDKVSKNIFTKLLAAARVLCRILYWPCAAITTFKEEPVPYVKR